VDDEVAMCRQPVGQDDGRALAVTGSPQHGAVAGVELEVTRDGQPSSVALSMTTGVSGSPSPPSGPSSAMA
jgi:hypothetical protein